MQEAMLAKGERLSQAQYGSDLVVEMFASLDIPYIALNPGSSYRGIHDSLVNFDIPGVPKMVVCNHETIAVSLAHGYARVTGKPLLVGLHDVVGLQNAAMGIYNAWCDRVPIIIMGGTGPVAAENRRPHIDWVHTANVQGNLVRDFVKFDDQPASIGSIPESILRSYRTAMMEPSAPVYLCFDVDLQESPVTKPIMLPDPTRFAPPAPISPDIDALKRAAELVANAQWPVILADGVGRHPEALPHLQELAELLQAPVVSLGRYNIATNHPLNVSQSRPEVLAKADVILGLDVFDMAGALGPGTSPEKPDTQFTNDGAKLINIALWDLLQRAWSSDYEILSPIDVPILADTRTALPLLVELCREALSRDSGSRGRIEDRSKAIADVQAKAKERSESSFQRAWNSTQITMDRVNAELASVIQAAGTPWSFVYGGSRGGGWEFTDPAQIAPGGRGSGLGQSPGASVGAALGHKGDGRLCISEIGDGDFLFNPSALWTGANLKLPLLTIINNNRSYGNDEGHQEHVARERGRPVENKGVGIFIEDPVTNFAKIAEGFGVEGIGPVEDHDALRPALERAVKVILEEGRPALVDVRTARRTRG